MHSLVTVVGAALLFAGGSIFSSSREGNEAVSRKGEPSTRAPAPSGQLLEGALPNGLRYILLSKPADAHKLSVRLIMHVGSMNETEAQRGHAHLIEHLTLAGAQSGGRSLIDRLEAAGLKVGDSVNAGTDFRHTTYKLDLPKKAAFTVEGALEAMRGVASEAAFDPVSVQREQNIVLAEDRQRSTPDHRLGLEELGFLLRGDLLPRRIPIGTEQAIRASTPSSLQSFYRTHYRPDRATILLVGDFDPEAAKRAIADHFEEWKADRAVTAEPPPWNPQVGAPRARLFQGEGFPWKVSLSWVGAYQGDTDTAASEARSLALHILRRRLSRLSTSPASPFVSATAIRFSPGQRSTITQFAAVPRAEAWERALSALEEEQRRAAQFGVTDEEVARAIAASRKELRLKVSASRREAIQATAEAATIALLEGRPVTFPVQDLAQFDRLARELTAGSVSQALREMFAGPGPLIHASAPGGVAGGEQALVAAFERSRRTEIQPLQAETPARWPYPPPSRQLEVIHRKRDAALGALLVRFENGVRLTVKPNRLVSDETLVSVRFGHGQLDIAPDRPSPAWGLPSAFIAGGLKDIAREDISEAFPGAIFDIDAQIADDAFVLRGRTTPADLSVQMQILAAYLRHPGWRPGGWDSGRAFAASLHSMLSGSPPGVFSRDSEGILHSGDRRWVFPTEEEIQRSSIDDAKEVLRPALAGGPVEVIIVGDVDPDAVVREAARAFADVAVARQRPYEAKHRHVRFPSGKRFELLHSGPSGQALGFIAWQTDDFFADRRLSRVLAVLAAIVQKRLEERLRAEGGLAYAPSASHTASRTFPGYGYLALKSDLQPDQLATFFTVAQAIAADLKAHAVGRAEMDQARAHLVAEVHQARRTNEWWSQQLAGAHDRPPVLRAILEQDRDYAAVTPADIQRAAQAFLDPDRSVCISVRPGNPVAATPRAGR